jgi:hypothetical protein
VADNDFVIIIEGETTWRSRNLIEASRI